MKLTTFRSFIIFTFCVGLISYVIAGPGSSGDHGPGFTSTNNPGVIGRTASTGATFNSQNNPGDMGSQFGQSTAANASANGSDAAANGSSNASSTGRTASSNGSLNGALHQNANAISHRDEKVVETPDSDEAAEASEKNETDPRFKGSVLDQGLPDIPNSHANAIAVEKTAAINPVTGLPIPPRPSFSAPPDKHPPVNPIPQATVPPQVPVTVGISPIPSASVSRGIDPVPSATVSAGR